MKNVIAGFCSMLALGFLISAPVNAQTPDGLTPAEETVCDPLRADGVTKGLYGLCVAFCESQDYAEISDPITEEEIKALEDAMPSGRILQNYNKKKTDLDPTMPCINEVTPEEPCSCFTTAQIAAIDGVIDNVSTSLSCSTLNTDKSRSVGEGGSTSGHVTLAIANANYFGANSCYYRDPAGSVGYKNVTEPEAQACLDMVNARCTELGDPPPAGDGV